MPLVSFAGRRLRVHPLLALLLAFGLIIASALVTAVPLFSEAIITVKLRQALATPASGAMPPAALLFRHTSTRFGTNLSASDVRRIDDYLTRRMTTLLPIPISRRANAGQTDRLSVFLGAPGAQQDSGQYGYFAYLSGLSTHARLLEGRWPNDVAGEGTLEAAMLTEGVDTLGIHVGDRIWVAVARGPGQELVPVQIVGRWYPDDPRDPYWFNEPSAYALAMIVPETTFLTRVSSIAPRGGRQFTWYFDVDPLMIRAADAGRLASGIAELRIDSQRLWRGLRLEAAPDDLLETYQRQTFLLIALLLSLAAPLVLIALQFVSMTASMRVERQRAEVAMLKSRGASTGQVLGIFTLEIGLLGVLATALGPPIGALLALGLGRLGGFFGAGPSVDLPVAISRDAFVYAGAAALVALLAALVPAAQASRATVVTYRQELTRAIRAPFWQRAYLDLLPLPVSAYAFLILQQRQSVVPRDAAGQTIPDPLLLLAPALFIFALTLVFLRLVPLLIRLLEWLGHWFAGPTILLALRQLARQPYDYRGLILMLVMTLAIGVFSASAALTIDVSEAAQIAYQVGADLRGTETGAYDASTGSWTLLPIGEYLRAPGVAAAARAARLGGQQRLGGRASDVQVLAIEPADFLQVTNWRDDYADERLLDLMGNLASGPNALIDRRLADSLRLNVGDNLQLTIQNQPVDVTIAGFVDYFPTLSRDNGPFLIINLDQLFDEVGPMPSEIWLTLKPGATATGVLATLDQDGLPLSDARSRTALLRARQSDVSRRGTFGLLAVGFLIGAGLSILSFLIYSYLSFRRRLIQIGILRAIGLGQGQVIGLSLAEQLLLIVLGAAAGVLIGLAASDLYVPFLQIHQTPSGPPTLVLTAWPEIERLLAAVGAGLLLVLPASLLLLRRVRLHEAIKLGEDA